MIEFAAVFMNTSRRGTLFNEASNCTAKMTAIKIALKEIHKREDNRLLTYIAYQSSMQSIKYNKDNTLILNQIYDILVELQN